MQPCSQEALVTWCHPRAPPAIKPGSLRPVPMVSPSLLAPGHRHTVLRPLGMFQGATQDPLAQDPSALLGPTHPLSASGGKTKPCSGHSPDSSSRQPSAPLGPTLGIHLVNSKQALNECSLAWHRGWAQNQVASNEPTRCPSRFIKTIFKQTSWCYSRNSSISRRV